MIIDTLNGLHVPYIVVKSKITSLFGEVGHYEYRIMANSCPGLRRLGLRSEVEISRYRGKYMQHILTKREAEVFRSRKYSPAYTIDDGCVWEFNGGVRRYERQYNRVE